MEYVVLALVVGGFAYFVYSRVSKSRKAKTEYTGVGGGRPRPDVNTQEK
jgi:hypothetical protein